LGNIEIFLAQNPIFLNGFPTFVNGFLLSLKAFCFPQRLSDFPQWLSTFQEIQENLSTVASIHKIAIRASYSLPLALQVVIPATMSTSPPAVAAADILKALGNTVPTTMTKKIRHIQAIQNQTAIMTGQREAPEAPPSPRVVAPTVRVVSAPPLRVATTLNNIKPPNVIRTMPLIHQRLH
jgi:hypothetical protein